MLVYRMGAIGSGVFIGMGIQGLIYYPLTSHEELENLLLLALTLVFMILNLVFWWVAIGIVYKKGATKIIGHLYQQSFLKQLIFLMLIAVIFGWSKFISQ
jgi:hypothetical protein